MAKSISSYLGQVHLLGKNPRTIRDNAFNRLCESIERDPTYLRARGIVVWLVPQLIPLAEGQKSPFVGQEGKLVVLGGNQRMKALLALGKKEIRKEWLIEAKDDDGSWWSPEQAERFVLLDNGGEGISGENDYREMIKSFSLDSMKLTGIDFSNLRELMEPKTPELVKTPKEKAETGDNGEKSEALKQFIANREETRKNLSEIDETGFHLLVVFESFEEKIAFISKAKLTGDKKRVAVNGDIYLDLVFESYAQKMEFVEKAGLADDENEGDGELKVVHDMFCDGRALAASMGIELKETGLHFRDRIVDKGLAASAREDSAQKSEEEQQEIQFAKAKKSPGTAKRRSSLSKADRQSSEEGEGEPSSVQSEGQEPGEEKKASPAVKSPKKSDAKPESPIPEQTPPAPKRRKTLKEQLSDFVD